MFFKQAYADTPASIDECNTVVEFFKEHYDLEDDDIVELHNATVKNIEEAYEDIKDKLKAEKITKKSTLYIHIFAGHATEKEGMQTLLLNQPDTWPKGEDGKRYDDFNHFYMRFEAEKTIRDLAYNF